MQVSITGKKIDIGDSLRTHTEDKIRTVVAKYGLEPLEATIVIHKDGHHRDGTFVRCDIDIHLGRGVYVRSHAETDDPYAGVDTAIDTLETRIKRHKTKIASLHRRREGAADAGAPANRYVIETKDEENANDAPLVIAEMKTSIPTLTVAEAVMHLDLSDSTAMMFQNDAHGELNVVYRRPDGNIGWISPQGR